MRLASVNVGGGPLQQLVDRLVDAVNVLLAGPLASAEIRESISVYSTKTTTVSHRLGRKARFVVASPSVPVLVTEAESDDPRSTLVVQGNADATVTLLLF